MSSGLHCYLFNPVLSLSLLTSPFLFPHSPHFPIYINTVFGSTQLEWDWWLDCWDGFSIFCPISLYQVDTPASTCTFSVMCELTVHVYMHNVTIFIQLQITTVQTSGPLLNTLYSCYRGSKLGFCILSNSCMGLGVNTVALLEIRGEGIQWNNFYQDISLDDDFHLGYVFLMLILDSIIYMVIAW